MQARAQQLPTIPLESLIGSGSQKFIEKKPKPNPLTMFLGESRAKKIEIAENTHTEYYKKESEPGKTIEKTQPRINFIFNLKNNIASHASMDKDILLDNLSNPAKLDNGKFGILLVSTNLSYRAAISKIPNSNKLNMTPYHIALIFNKNLQLESIKIQEHSFKELVLFKAKNLISEKGNQLEEKKVNIQKYLKF